ncbi:MAG: glycosyltransferase family 39 protein [Candidatus Melainabacteria bacterium]|nr:glycosyltransferase family 39 protein [Candidatus Melainabacteria bacterium]
MLVFIVVASFLFRAYYAFECLDPAKLLGTDMGGYWSRANARFSGEVFNIGQTIAFSPLYHIILSEIFKIIEFFGFLDKKLEIIILLNIFLSSASIIFVYLIANQLIKKRFLSILATFIYAFYYFLIHINAYILSENIVVPLLIISIYLLLRYPDQKFILFLNGILLGFIVGVRPPLGLFALSYVGYIFFACNKSFRSLIRIACLLLGCLLIIFSCIVEYNHISRGKLRSLSAHGGVNFFMAQCKSLSVKSKHNGLVMHLVPPVLVANKQLLREKPLETNVPFYDQGYYYEKGFQCLKEHPEDLIGNLTYVKALITGPFFPGKGLPKWLSVYRDIARKILLFTCISLGLLCLLIRDKKVDCKKVFLFLSFPFLVMLVSYFYTCDGRCFYPVTFLIFILFFLIVEHIKQYKNQAIFYFFVLLVVYLIFHCDLIFKLIT